MDKKNFTHFGSKVLPSFGAISVLLILICILSGNLHAQELEIVQEKEVTGVLPAEEVFDPLIADPRWPHFSASIQIIHNDEKLQNIGAVNIGASFALLGWKFMGGKWQLGLHSGVFSIFDLNAPSDDLINSDFRVGIPLSFRFGPFSGLAKVYHQSSHLGDEFILRNRPDRVDLSYEGVDVLFSLDLGQSMRMYGGGGKLISSTPVLKENSLHFGFELISPNPLLGGVYPLVAADIQSFEETDWNENYSAQAGFEIRSDRFSNRKLLFVFEYFKGNSPNGQFFELQLQSYGAGVHFFF